MTRLAFIIGCSFGGGRVLQRLLNSRPGVCIRGSNRGALASIARMAEDLAAARRLGAEARHSGLYWYGAGEIEDQAFLGQVAQGFVTHVLRPPEGTSLAGFTDSEHPMPSGQFRAYCDFLRGHFPGALLIFHGRGTQGLVEAARAAGASLDPAAIDRANEQFREYALAHPDCSILIRHEDYAADEQGLKPLFERLGLGFDAAGLREVLALENPALARPGKAAPAPEPPKAAPPAPGRIENGVLAGKDGWLFLWTGSNEVHRYYTDPAYFTDRELQAWARLLETRQERLAAMGARYRHVTVPDKLSLHPELTGQALPHHGRHPARQLAARLPGDGLNIDLMPALGAAAQQAPVFFRTDSHWTFEGCQAAYRRICAALDVAPRDFSDRPRGGRTMAMDLGNKFTPPVEEDARFTTVLRDARRVAQNGMVRYNEETGFRIGRPRFVGCYSRTLNESPEARPETIMLFGDSFSEFRPHLLMAMLAETFRELHFVWSTSLDFDLVARIRPQIVISEIAERFMATLPRDDFRVETD